MIAWMLFAALVAALAGLAALAAERGLALFRLPTRWAWAASIAASLALPLLLPARPEARSDVGGMMLETVAAAPAGTPLVGGNVVAGGARGLDPVAPWAWLATSVAVAGVLAAAARRLARRRRGWTAAVVAGEPVLLSGEVGPAVVGFLRPSIVIPRWTLDWPEPRLRMIVRHEREHVAAADPALLLAGLCAAVLVPWSPALWWQLRRLRLAVEVDCDARTLRAGPDPAAYGRLLLEVGSRGRAGAVPLAAFSEPRSFLERRIRAMTLRTPRNRALRLASWTALAAAAVVSAAALPAPPLPAPATVPRPALADTTQPALLNAAAVRRELEAEYPPMLRAAGVTGTAVLRFRVNERGAPIDAEVVSASHPAF
ncbi:MAG: M56 family metallopeptidase, partial [Longimicrobiaceae bacterium]